MKSFVVFCLVLACAAAAPAPAKEARPKRGLYHGLTSYYDPYPEYTAPLAYTPHVYSVNRLINVNKVVDVPHVVNVRRVLTVPEVVSENRVVHHPTYTAPILPAYSTFK